MFNLLIKQFGALKELSTSMTENVTASLSLHPTPLTAPRPTVMMEMSALAKVLEKAPSCPEVFSPSCLEKPCSV